MRIANALAIFRESGLRVLFALFLAFWPLLNFSQPAARVWRIGLLTGDRPGTVEALVAGLREFKYVEGRNVILETRRYSGLSEMDALASELLRLSPDIIVVGGAAAAKSVSKLSKGTPVVMATSFDAVGQGVIASLARPGGNVTGFTDMAGDLTAKRAELLRELAPQATRVAVLGCPEFIGTAQGGSATLGQMAGVTFIPVFVRQADDLAAAFANAKRQRPDAVLVLECGILPKADVVINLVNDLRVPAVFPSPRYAVAGGLVSYGPDTTDQYRRSAAFVDKILRGARPADIPVEQPSKLLLVVNLKAARTMNLGLPQKLLLQADQVIE